MTPQTEAELAEMIASATGPLRVHGGGTRPIGGPVEGAVLETGGMRGIHLYEPGALTLVAGAGTPLSEVEAALDAEGQRLPFEPMDHRALLGTTGTPTVGGMAAANVSGSRRIQVGACRDFMLGVRFVDGMGRVLKNGGRVMKNVTGYDLVKLMAGSFGTLGVLSEVSFKVLPKPETSAVIQIGGLSDARAVEAMAAALGSPFDVTGAAHMPKGQGGVPITMIRIEGFEKSVTYRAEQLKSRLSIFGEIAVETQAEKVAADWQWLRDVEAFADQPGDVWRISVKPSDGPRVGAALQAEQMLYDWGGGLIWALVAPGRDIRPAMAGIGGHATLVRADEATRATIPAFQPEPAPVAALSRGVRAKFDPRGILNPGLMG
ncbi:putative FAD-linked oxidoreductase [Thalassovita gelatinovora]|uniref:Putative FAD-linked oxidoreductase n=1 Tax=Thalassovita gelatinovora TaxID=53501 RepID=A0A0P1FRS3_THAGE|nr:FAD-binding protein [Thalassovita gelatinovora]QIZ80812.1 FAD-binding protein [Thalassovita gelatinovora]CUH63214.1 putative FAD-linked oxidoreductase [Thalassovita gelatinovora]SEQ63550.1 glycolate oxidase FAD binding subunit [Thalassovita gelatinovora]